MNIVAKHVISAQNALVLQPYQLSKNTSTAIHGIHKAISQKLVTATNNWEHTALIHAPVM